MRWCTIAPLATGILLTAGPLGRTQETGPSQATAVAEIRRLGGTVEVDEKDPAHPALKVDLHNTATGDDDLRHLAGLARLRTLDLSGTKVTDAGLKHLAGLAGLREIGVDGTQVSKQGIADLQGVLVGLQLIHLHPCTTTLDGNSITVTLDPFAKNASESSGGEGDKKPRP
jgi:hypothetical protein